MNRLARTRLPPLPHELVTSQGHKVVMNLLQPENVAAVREMFRHFEGAGTVGLDEGIAETMLAKPFDVGRSATQIVDGETGEVLGAGLFYPSVLARSSRPLLAGGYGIMAEKAQRKGITRDLSWIRTALLWQLGYLGRSTRSVIGSKGTFYSLATGSVLTGTIPYSVLTSRGTRLPDVVDYVDLGFLDPEEYQRRVRAIHKERNIDPVPPDASLPLPEWVLDDIEIPPSVRTSPDLTISIQISSASQADVLPVEALIRDAAKAGRGFALDEFQDGFFNRRCLQQSHMVTAKTTTGTIIGGAIFGRTGLCRSKTTPILSAYIVSHVDYTHTGADHMLLSAVEDYVRREKLAGLLIDCFMTDSRGMQFLKDHGFVSICTFPACGYVKNCGITDSLLFYKQFHHPNLSAL